MRFLLTLSFTIILLPIYAMAANMEIVLNVNVSPDNKTVSGTVLLKSAESRKAHLVVDNIRRLQKDEILLSTEKGRLTVPLSAGKETTLVFEADVEPSRANYMDHDHVFLTGNWFPKPTDLARYQLNVTFPKGFLAVSEANSVETITSGTTVRYQFQFNHLVDGLTLAASRNYVLKRDSYNDIEIQAYFFKEDINLADDYLAFSKKYLAMYEKMLTPYPYKRFVVAENVMPTGYSMPTYTLLGKTVVRLPFITRTSLGHEILHQWFGNSIYIDYSQGNWAEGLTNYLADHYYATAQNKGSAYRKQILVDYNAYVDDSTKMPISKFYSRHNKAESAIGYGKSALLFHNLRRMVGDALFFEGLKTFIATHRFERASWGDIESAHEKVSGMALGSFFDQWLQRDDIPKLQIEDARLIVIQGRLNTQFTIVQPDPPYFLQVPVSIVTPAGTTDYTIETAQPRKVVTLITDEVPTEVIVDRQYDLMREMAESETPAVLARIMGKKKVLVVGPTATMEKYQPVLDALGVDEQLHKTSNEVTLQELKTHSTILLGYQSPTVNAIFGRQPEYDDGVRIRVEKNPYQISEVMMLLHVKNLAEAKAVKRKLPHYGKYAHLIFDQGNLSYKAGSHVPNGIPVLTHAQTTAIRPDRLSTLEAIMPDLLKARIIYVGEQHTKYAHHLNQLKVIQTLHEAGKPLAVGMEMFQQPFQAAVNDYLAGRSDEREFLKACNYFERWRFDYNLYKPIIDYLKKKNIPLVALNIDGDISRKVARQGIDALSQDELKHLPPELELTDSVYRQDLLDVYGFHDKQHQLINFDYFLQAQVLWDESMAEATHRFLASHPETSMVVLAGNGHVRHKYGIPKRVFRRNGQPYLVIVQDEKIQAGIADYVLQTVEIEGAKAPLLGVSIESKKQMVRVSGVTEKSPAGNAGIEKGDILVQIGDQPIQSLADLKHVLFYTTIGESIDVTLLRDGEKVKKKVILSEFTHGKK